MKMETITCDCSTVFQWTPDSDNEWIIDMMRPKFCPKCTERIEAESEEQRQLEREERIGRYMMGVTQSVRNSTPLIFQTTDPSHADFNANGLQLVEDWKSTFEKPWLGLIGPTGTCKTRIAYLLAASEIQRQARNLAQKLRGPDAPTFAFIASYEITDLACNLSAADFGRKDAARDALNKLRRVNLLLIDDLGKGRLPPSVASELFAIIDYRYANALPMIWTANSEPAIIAASLSKDMAAPFAGRLHDSSRIVRLK